MDYISDYLLDGSNKRHNIGFIILKCKMKPYTHLSWEFFTEHTLQKKIFGHLIMLTRDTSKYKICSEFSSANVWILSIWRVWIRNLNIVSWLIRRWYTYIISPSLPRKSSSISSSSKVSLSFVLLNLPFHSSANFSKRHVIYI